VSDTATDPGPGGVDLDAVRRKYLEERDKRLVEGRAAIRDLTSDEVFAKYREDPFTPVTPRNPVAEDVDVAIIGAGMAGVVAGAHLRKVGVERIRMIDQAGGIGGTWYWNRYPGVMCDVESYTYMPMLEEMGYLPTTRYAFGDEIRRHFLAIAEKYDLVGSALFHTGVERSEWDDTLGRWVIRTDRGDEVRAKYLVLAVGILNLMKLPVIEGMEKFRGKAFHTARWDFGYTGGTPDGKLEKLADKSVGIIGTGASAIQAIPHLAESSGHLYVFQRTPGAVGVRGNRATPADFAQDLAPGWQRERMENFQAVMLGRPVDVDMVDDGWCHHFAPTHNVTFEEGMTPDEIMRKAEEVDYEIMEEHRDRIREIVQDPEKVAILTPYYRYLCRRPLFHDEYLLAFNRDNVTVVDCPAGLDCVTERGVVVGGREYELDCIVYATGFQAEATPLSRRAGHDVTGRNGMRLAEKWESGAHSLFGMMTRGFPNLFIMPAPGQQAVVTVNHTLVTVVGAEHISATIAQLEQQGVARFEVSEQAEQDWCDKILEGYRDGSAVMEACTPSRINNEGNPRAASPLSGSYGGGLGDYFGFVQLLAAWLAEGDLAGLELGRSRAELPTTT
jgi:cation diffusion facilitator CzcD-associated flavoprotein CzcO